MNTTTVRVPELAWYGNGELELDFPASWQVSVCQMRGHDRPRLGDAAIRGAFSRPFGASTISELARDRRQVAILFDDMSRPTRSAQLIPCILEELEAAGVGDGDVRFIAAVGAHGPLTRLDFAKKLGEEVLERFPVYNHNPYENCTYLGETSRGTPVSVNTEVMGCDLKIGIGCILPHPLTGFGGGGKIVLPGVASIDTIAAHHANLIAEAFARGEDVGTGLGVFDENPLRLDVAEAAAMAGLDIKIDTVVNGRGEMAGLFVGEPVTAHTDGVKMAREAYATRPAESPDVVVLNTYCKASEVVLAVPLLPQLLGDSRADVVLIASAPEGQVTHYLARSFGSRIGGRLWLPRTSLPPSVNRLIVLTRYRELSGADWLAPLESVIWAKTWPEVVDRLKEFHGESASVAVVPDATMQYFPA
jgi:nickel-dependent lactate racemase